MITRARKFFYYLMTDRLGGPLFAPLKFILWALSLVYGIIIKVLLTGYEKKLFTPFKADTKVISIGNITVGGTGKTQAAVSVARILEASGRKPAILIRGYGADEQQMLREELKDTPVLVGPDRIKNSKRAFYDFGLDTVILDDGFQHFKIHRDLDIALIDATRPFGNHELIPRGILREPITSLKRAGLIIVTKVDSDIAKTGEVYSVIERLGMKDRVVEAVYKPLNFYDLDTGRPEGLQRVRGKKICLVSSIANPSYFRQNILKLGARIELEHEFLDHYDYKKSDFIKIGRECAVLGIDLIVVTKKDAVKIKRLALANEVEVAVPILVFEVDFAVTKNKELLYDRLSGVYSS